MMLLAMLYSSLKRKRISSYEKDQIVYIAVSIMKSVPRAETERFK